MMRWSRFVTTVTLAKTTSATTWTTKAGTFTATSCKVKLKLLSPEFNQTKEMISWTCHVDDATPTSTTCYGMIIVLQAVGSIIDFNDHTMTWDKAINPMKEYGKIFTLVKADAYCDEIYTTDVEQEVTTQMTRIHDAK